eukprot:CAMPEP_0198118766 /NCGR_PEP_ID=MMETSP1442-20131203/22995_1 /TAXON_ID= /ORGANISM="Craspedostauros australis, Strain CCMP3328" /LENGTH=205 /DNA_ID=CAMNT_0043777081 /DNA_START=40 /DNA_END=657 /DNA_ORIENTATION=-
MKFTAISCALVVASASAFAPSKPAFTRTDALQATSTRGEFFGQLAGAVAVASAFPGAANAAKYGGFGAGSPSVLDPKSAIIDDEIFATDAVQSALKEAKAYRALVDELKKALDANGQADLGPALRKQFDFAKLRASLNTLNSAFDEETQLGTDRLIRVILQDLTEIEVANKQKEGIERSERRINNLLAKIAKLQKSFDEYLAFAN